MKNRKSLGQHWLHDRQILDRIAQISLPDSNTPVACLEIGPGLGTLTSSLLRIFPRVIAIELDDRLAKNLPHSFPGKSHQLTVINANFLDFDLSTLPTPYVVSANIPYYITSPIIEKLLTSPHPPQKITLLIQKEVAQRINQPSGHHTMLSLTVQNLAVPTLEFLVPAKLFTPPPKVDSAVITLTPRSTPLVSSTAIKLASLGFSAPRKKLLNNLSSHYQLSVLEATFAKLQLSRDLRPADLSHQDWQNLTHFLASP